MQALERWREALDRARSRRRTLRAHILADHLRDRFMVTTKTGDTFDATIAEVDLVNLVLDDVKVYDKSGTWIPADGLVFLHRSNVAYMQRTTRQTEQAEQTAPDPEKD